MKYRQATYFVIIFLLVLFVPITIFSTVKNIQKALYVENPNHQFKYDNKLYFFNGDKIIGRYYCKTANCDLTVATVTRDDSIILKENIPTTNLAIQPINNKFAFITDESSETETNAILYNIEEEKTIAQYKEVKNYNIGLDNDNYIVKNSNDKYGMVALKNAVQLKIPFEYDYIGTNYSINEETNKIATTGFAVKKGGVWQIISDTASVLSTTFTDVIYNYNSFYVILKNKNNNEMYVSNYNGDKVFTNTYSYLDFYNNYLVMIDNSHYFSMYNLSTSFETKKYLVNSIDDVTITSDDSNINVVINNEIVEKLAIS